MERQTSSRKNSQEGKENNEIRNMGSWGVLFRFRGKEILFSQTLYLRVQILSFLVVLPLSLKNSLFLSANIYNIHLYFLFLWFHLVKSSSSPWHNMNILKDLWMEKIIHFAVRIYNTMYCCYYYCTVYTRQCLYSVGVKTMCCCSFLFILNIHPSPQSGVFSISTRIYIWKVVNYN